ncbi:endonuclease [Bacillus sp. AK031]
MYFYQKYGVAVVFILLLCVTAGCTFKDSSSGGYIKTNGSDTALSIGESLLEPEGKALTVEGFIVGQPLSGDKVVREGFSNDFALTLADSKDETESEKMIFIQIPLEFRERYGLKSNPSLLGEKLKVSGVRESYFAHRGIKSIKEIVLVSMQENPDYGEEIPEVEEAYYEEARGKTGLALKSALHNIIDDHRMLSYNGVWEALRVTDEDPSNRNNVILLYTGRSQSKQSNGGGSEDWNREHVWAKSHGSFGTSQGAGTDLHHLRPTDTTVNSSRSNLDFDNGGIPHKEAFGNYSDADSWEPRDEVKGDVARMLFYMAVRYEGDNGETDLELNNKVDNRSNPFHGRVSVLLDWHKKDPVDKMEIRRNNIIFENYQGNRNPFIDHPEWAELIW